ncbi:MAG: hypothetical protein Q7S11_00915 [bacterium]|nr:hypothetical protein [bacterium]
MITLTKKEIIAFGILVVFAAGGIMLYVSQEKTIEPTKNEASGIVRIIPVDHYFENGIHVYRGILTVPTPCHELVSQVTVMESYPEQVTIDLNEQGASSFCAQVITQTPFEVTFKASKDARVSLKLDGVLAALKITDLSAQQQAGKSDVKSIAPISTTTTNTTVDDSFLYEGSATQ